MATTKKSTTKKTTKSKPKGYAARLEIDYPESSDRLTTFFRLFMLIPIAIILGLISGSGETITNTVYLNEFGELIYSTRDTAGGMVMGIGVATALMIVFRQVYPKWWFDFMYQLTCFEARVASYAALLMDQYPSTTDVQSVHLEVDYPNVEKDLNRWLPLVKWFLAIPHYIILAILSFAGVFVVIYAWFAILITGRHPRGSFNYLTGVMRWWLRVNAYAFLLVTDEYPAFGLE